MSKYTIWDKQSPIIVPTGKVYTAEEWKEKYPIARIDRIKVVCADGDINGAFFGTLAQMVAQYSAMGADFTGATTEREKLDVIEAWEDADHSNGESTAEERIAAALEFNNLLQLPTVNDDDPDLD